MAPEAVQPLRINKSSSGSSPVKADGSALSRPLAEISPMERRRNSPSYNQATKQMMLSRGDSSPFDPSPQAGGSPRNFWKGQAAANRFNSENVFEREQSPSVAKRRSIEKLMQASRVKNSSMFAREQKNEYDPTSTPVVERPLAANRPLSVQVQGNAYGGKGLDGLRQETNPVFKGHRRGESQNKIPLLSPSKTNAPSPQKSEQSQSPSPRYNPSPSKSSFSSRPTHNTLPRSFEAPSGMWSDEDESQISPTRTLRRYAKSVTFDHNPPKVNEYEMVTPDPSSVTSGSRQGSYDSYDDQEEDDVISLDQGASDGEDSFDASLEDTDKTPVVLPDDWQHMSPETAGNALINTFDDPFNDNEDELSTPSQPWTAFRAASDHSDGDHRPLPPTPGFLRNNSRPGSANSLASVVDRVQAAHAQRSLPTPPRAAGISKSDLLCMKNESSITVEDRLRLMGMEDHTSPKDTGAKEAARLKKHGLGIHVFEDEVEEDLAAEPAEAQHEEYKCPRISRESILRKVNNRSLNHNDEYDLANLDPDVPIPSREVSSNFDEDVEHVVMKQEDDDEPVDLYSIAEMYGVDQDDEFEREGSIIRHDMSAHSGPHVEDDAESCYSHRDSGVQPDSTSSAHGTEDARPSTPAPKITVETSTPRLSNDREVSLPDFSGFYEDGDFQSGLESYLSASSTPPPQVPVKDDVAIAEPPPTSTGHDLSSVHRYFQQETSAERQTAEPEVVSDSEPGTPESVVHHPISRIESPGRDLEMDLAQTATIQAPDAHLQVRDSPNPADTATMAATRRKVSGENPPPIPEKSPKRNSLSREPGPNQAENDKENVEAAVSPSRRRQSFKRIDIGDSSFGEDISFGLDEEFNRVIESSKVAFFPLASSAQYPPQSQSTRQQLRDRKFPSAVSLPFADLTSHVKKGYLMRENTKVVIAKREFSNETTESDHRPSSAHAAGTRSAGSSPRKTGHERTKSWTTEPWNGKARRKSIRTTSGSKKSASNGPVPPMPGQESVVTGLDTVAEDSTMNDSEDMMGEGIERGRLFVKVVGIKDLELPMPRNEQTYFQLTLDNGLHCVTTSWLELGRSAPIGQEFELVVLNDLEFQLTLQTKLTRPVEVAPVASVPRPRSPVKSAAKISSFASFLKSPRKRREAERVAKEKHEEEEKNYLAAERRRTEEQRMSSRSRASNDPCAWDLLHELVGEDGSFGRAYVSLKNHESQCFGRPMMVDMPVFNEWAIEDAAIASSVKSKRGGALRRPPYQVGKLTLQLLYVPRPVNASEEDMPRSMNACIREMRDAEESDGREWEGHLSQQGGDCPYWRRRFFRLVGTKLTAYHETTRQPRAKIELAKATKLIDDRGSLLQPDTGKSGKTRRKSGFAEEDEAYQFVEEGFRIRFANGETIDFYADDAKDKADWVAVLRSTVGKSAAVGKGWCQLVLAQERKTKTKDQVTARPHSADGLSSFSNVAKNSRSVPTSPVKPMRDAPVAPAAQHRQQQFFQPNSRPQAPDPRTSPSRRKQIQSMIF